MSGKRALASSDVDGEEGLSETGARSCRFVLLGVPVIVRSPSREILERVALCYGAHPGHREPDAACLHGSVEPIRAREATWSVRVDQREEGREDDVTAAIRRLNHELVHGVMLRRPDLFYVHAGVVAVSDDTVILPGLSRAGKSTLVLALLQRGARFLSDELLVYDPRARRLLPFPRAIKVRDEYGTRLRERSFSSCRTRVL